MKIDNPDLIRIVPPSWVHPFYVVQYADENECITLRYKCLTEADALAEVEHTKTLIAKAKAAT